MNARNDAVIARARTAAPTFSLGLDPRVHTIPATPNGCPDQRPDKKENDWPQCAVPNPHPEPVEGRGFKHRACRPSFDRLRMRLGGEPEHDDWGIGLSGI